ncbi:hypothetical protein ACFX2H_003743 [Malus domestica]
MPTRMDSRPSVEPSFPNIAQLRETIANAIQSSLRPPQMTPLETVYNLKLNHFMGNEGHEGAEKWINHLEKTFRVMQSQGIFILIGGSRRLPGFWVWSPHPGGDRSLINCHKRKQLTRKCLNSFFQKRFIPPKYIDRKKQEFTQLKQAKMMTNEYYRRFTDLSRYYPEVTANPVKMLRRFRLGLRTQKICPVRVKKKKKIMGIKGEMIKVKVSLLNDLARLRALREVELVPVLLAEVLVPLVRGEVVDFQEVLDSRGREMLNDEVIICAADSLQRPQQPSMPPPVPIQQVPGSGSYGQMGRGGAYHYQGDAAPYTPRSYQYSQDPYYQSGYSQYPGWYTM